MFYSGEFVVAHCEDVLQRKKIDVAQKEEKDMGCHGGKRQMSRMRSGSQWLR